MNIRQALKIRDHSSSGRYNYRTLRKALFTCRRHRRMMTRHSGFRCWDKVIIQTDTVYDSVGVPVSVFPGAIGHIVEFDGFPQVALKISAFALYQQAELVIGVEGVPDVEIVGVPVEHLRRA